MIDGNKLAKFAAIQILRIALVASAIGGAFAVLVIVLMYLD
jgi:hypothetical protein